MIAVSGEVFTSFLRFLEVLLLLVKFLLRIQTSFEVRINLILFYVILIWLVAILSLFLTIFFYLKFIIYIKLLNIHGSFFLLLNIRNHIANIFEDWMNKIIQHECPSNEVKLIIHSLTYIKLVSLGKFINVLWHLYIYELIHIINSYIWKEFLQATILKF